MNTILIVCEGNVCRSVYVCAALAARLRSLGLDHVTVRSAGARTTAGLPAFHRTVAALGESGVDASASVSAPLTPTDVADAGLVITMERWHRGAVVELAPRALRYTFTLREAAVLAQGTATSDASPASPDLSSFATALRSVRLDVALPIGADADIPDPVRGDQQDFDRFRARADADIDTLALALARTQEVAR